MVWPWQADIASIAPYARIPLPLRSTAARANNGQAYTGSHCVCLPHHHLQGLRARRTQRLRRATAARRRQARRDALWAGAHAAADRATLWTITWCYI